MNKNKARFVAAIVAAMLAVITWGMFLLYKPAAMILVYTIAVYGFIAFACGLAKWFQDPGMTKSTGCKH